MRHLTRAVILAGAAASAFSGAVFAPPSQANQRPPPSTGKPLSTRVVAYGIEAKLDPEKHTITATETLTYQNLTGHLQQTFPFHLYLNAFQPQSTFMTEMRLYGTRGNGPDSGWD